MCFVVVHVLCVVLRVSRLFVVVLSFVVGVVGLLFDLVLLFVASCFACSGCVVARAADCLFVSCCWCRCLLVFVYFLV